MKQKVANVRAHIERVQIQYTELRNLKTSLPDNDVIVQMDFSDISKCSNNEEVKSAYWNPTSVTLNPAVIYYKTKALFLSEILSHNTVMIGVYRYLAI